MRGSSGESGEAASRQVRASELTWADGGSFRLNEVFQANNQMSEPGKPVWGLYENYVGQFGKLVELFSSAENARNCALLQPLLQSQWRSQEAGLG